MDIPNEFARICESLEESLQLLSCSNLSIVESEKSPSVGAPDGTGIITTTMPNGYHLTMLYNPDNMTVYGVVLTAAELKLEKTEFVTFNNITPFVEVNCDAVTT